MQDTAPRRPSAERGPWSHVSSCRFWDSMIPPLRVPSRRKCGSHYTLDTLDTLDTSSCSALGSAISEAGAGHRAAAAGFNSELGAILI